jgi:DNA-binding NarL/FixJ family response regulator
VIIRVLLADDHELVRDGMASLLRREPGIEVVAQAADGEAALREIEARSPDVAVLDIGMPRMTGIEVARKVRDGGHRTAIVLVSVHKDRDFVQAGFEAGISAYVLKESTTRELLDAVLAAAADEVFLSRGIGASIVEALSRDGPPGPDRLTPRERDIVRLVADGLASKEIAARLGIGIGTVNWYRATVMEKLGVRGLAGLVKYAIKHQLATLDD